MEAATNLQTAQVRTDGTHVRLLHVVEPFPLSLAEAAGGVEYPDFATASREQRVQAKTLLKSAAHKLRIAGFEVTSAVEEGDVRSINSTMPSGGGRILCWSARTDERAWRGCSWGAYRTIARHAKCSVEIVRIEP